MRTELIEYLANLFVAYPKQSHIVEAIYFCTPGSAYGNSQNTLIKIFRDLGVLWHEYPETGSNSWKSKYKSTKKDYYIKPYVFYDIKKPIGKNRIEVCVEALEFLEKETKAIQENHLTMGVERAIVQLALLAKKYNKEVEGLDAINRELIIDKIHLTKTLLGKHKFEYGILSNSKEPLLKEAYIALKNTEEGFRLLIYQVLRKKKLFQWESLLGISEERLYKVKERMKNSQKKGTDSGESSILDYFDIFDLRKIVEHCWDLLHPWLKDKNETLVLLSILEPLRNVIAHYRKDNREDLMLVIGISKRLGEKLRNGLMENKNIDSSDYN